MKAIFVYTNQGSLQSLEKLEVGMCKELVEIVAKDETATEEANEELHLFPNITSLKVKCLPNLRCIYPEMPIQEWPVLKKLYVEECPKLKFFATECQHSVSLKKVCLLNFVPRLIVFNMSF